MELQPHIENLQRQLTAAADLGGDDARELAQRLIAPLDAAIRLTLLDVLGAAAEEITTDLSPGSVQLRLAGREPEFAVTPAAVDPPEQEHEAPTRPPAGVATGEDAAMARINLRLPDSLKTQIEGAAAGEALSVNAWLVRAAAAGVERTNSEPHAPRSAQRYSGWVR